jgi:4-hydroxybenzoate polyprenyltransferase
MRLDHAVKNVFILPGLIVPLNALRVPLTASLCRGILAGFLATTLVASSNYVLNEMEDRPFDRFHPTKRNRAAAMGLVGERLATLQWFLLMAAGMALALAVSRPFVVTAALLWFMGCLYNLQPVRTKDRVYLDVLSEAVNNPLRMLLGWFMVTSSLVPPASLLLCYWMLGCYLMALKRFSEYRELGDPGLAGRYRKSFMVYTEVSLLSSVLFYAAAAMLFFGAFIMRYRIEWILAFPFVALLMATYFRLAFEPGSAVQHPEKLYRSPLLMLETGFVAVLMLLLLRVDVPAVGRALAPTLPMAVRR